MVGYSTVHITNLAFKKHSVEQVNSLVRRYYPQRINFHGVIQHQPKNIGKLFTDRSRIGQESA